MKIGDKAEANENPEIVLARSSVGLYELADVELSAADELTAEGEFPKYGDYLKTHRVNGSGSPTEEVNWVECPAGLAARLAEYDGDLDDSPLFHVKSVRKVDGEWQYEVEMEPDL